MCFSPNSIQFIFKYFHKAVKIEVSKRAFAAHIVLNKTKRLIHRSENIWGRRDKKLLKAKSIP